MTPANIVKINRAHRKGWTANEIAGVYGFRRSEVQRVWEKREKAKEVRQECQH